MPKPIVFIAALLLALPAFAQTRMPARQVEADTNMVNITVSYPFTAQAALDWIDANWLAISSESWSNLDPAEDTVQSVFDWVDDNWQAELDAKGWIFLDPESPVTVRVRLDRRYMGIDTSGWGYLAPTASTARPRLPGLIDGFSGWIPTPWSCRIQHRRRNSGKQPADRVDARHQHLPCLRPDHADVVGDPFTNISLKQSTNWSFTINTNTHVGELTYAPYGAPASLR